jgi:hypothetical protein
MLEDGAQCRAFCYKAVCNADSAVSAVALRSATKLNSDKKESMRGNWDE